MAEPRLEDDVAYYGNERCDECGERHDPDESHDYGDDPIECGMKCMNSNRPEGITDKDEEEEMLAKFWADYGESMWVDPMEQEWMWDEKTN